MTVVNFNNISGINSITAESNTLNFYDSAGNTLSIGASVSGNITGNVTGNVTGNINASGVSTFSGGIVVSAGSTAAPSISPTGDSNTGIFFPAPDTIIIGTNSSERIRVGSAGTITLRATGGAFIEGYNADNNQLDVMKLSRMGYDTPYRNLVVGKHLPNSTSYTYQSLSLNYDPRTNSSGSFSGWGNEIFVPNNNQSESVYTRIIQPNTSNNGFNALMSFGSNGEVARPNQPAFFARSLSNPNTNSYVTSLAAALIFTNKDFDNNNDYNNTNGRFTAPITGAYYFLASILVDDNTPINTVTRIEFRKNGSFCGPVAYFYGPGSCYIQMTAAGCVSMNVGDYLEVWGTNGFIHVGDETHFTGFLL